jgi:zinc D-Ala-D-Ala dipeptidase
MNAAPSKMPPTSYLSCARTADQLRTYLMGISSGACRMAASQPAVPPGLVDVREAAPRVLALPAPPWSDPELRFKVRPEVAARLRHAAEALPEDLRLGLWEGLRPVSIQMSLWEASLDFLQSSYPSATTVELEAMLESYVARPTGIAPPHSTGSAVDIAAVDVFGRVLNPQEAWGKLGTEILSRALRDAGLVNYETEWWHWSYGDEEWARANDCAPLAFAATPEFDGPGGGI